MPQVAHRTTCRSYGAGTSFPFTALAKAVNRRLIFLKGNNAHDYKFSSAVLEDFYHVSPEWRDKYLAASVFNLTGSGARDNDLIQRARSALGA